MNDIHFFSRNGYLPVPKILQLEITTVCPLKCPQCYKSLNPKHIQMNTLTNILNEAKNAGVKSIMLNGGEPAVHPDFIKIVKMISQEYGMNAYCFLSGYNMTEKYANELNSDGVFVTFSLNGSCEEVNGLSRDGFQYSINALQLFNKLHIPCGINWVARKDNVFDFPELVQLAKRLQVKWINIIRNKIVNDSIQADLQTDEYEYLAKLIKEYRNEIEIRIEGCNSILTYFIGDRAGDLFNGCQAGRIAMFADIDGDFMPCSHLYYKEKAESLLDYWNHSEALKRLRESNKVEKCEGCIKAKNCYFCKAGAKETHDNFFAPYEECAYKNFVQQKWVENK
ncbi:radical SAM protein [Anaeromicropila populeti]|uniref:Radical SAM superfamily enzyme, MoaA/NifB/PqqE/SkfB family n=1 Tax=Anaeromicropila populeti TaxID=37658 RepID=A0A1I6IN06_9FIRM|nr:radical SAM protein [Anaeromicropila populeti]SFR68147.1 Radical SAM superfamily enzyme, MoaA/NifB/PqqE/SkfB family [Anaeromicropila populeti]